MHTKLKKALQAKELHSAADACVSLSNQVSGQSQMSATMWGTAHMFDRKDRATALLALRSSASSTSSPMYSPECNVSTCVHQQAIMSQAIGLGACSLIAELRAIQNATMGVAA